MKIGWYVDWKVQTNPARPLGMQFAQMIRVHQKLTCPSRTTPDRGVCPYVEPYEYEVKPSISEIEEAVRANPGSIWLVGNEIERIDWFGGGQDEILPDFYPVVYHDLYTLIKGIDPTAKVAIGGIIQPTPLRLEYLSIVWDSYQQRYGEPMPVDVWNIHNFIIREKWNEWGASIPVGVDAPNGTGSYVLPEGATYDNHIDMQLFDQQTRAMRQWMKDRGQQEKPLIITEYGVLYPNWLLGLDASDVDGVNDFMIATFDYFLHTKDCDIGYTADDCRLVQMWNWYSLDERSESSFNIYSRLYDPVTKEMTATGERVRTYSLANINELNYRLK